MPDTILTPREIRRYDKQIMIPEIGIEGQKKLRNSNVAIIGAGGLGCPVLQYLTAAGIGKLSIIEFDKVDETNLQRQVLYGSDDVGKLKSIIAKNRLEHLNSFTDVEILNIRLNEENSQETLKESDIVVDATDNLRSRYIINDTCVILNKPMVHGAIYKFEGQVGVFNYKGGSTYRCFNPYSSEKNFRNPAPSEAGLLGVLPGIAGTFMANEVIKIITGVGNVLCGKVLFFNILDYSFRLIKIKNLPENHIIGKIGEMPTK
jgi:sulfur-carrier protein adenylyltransferase/sulfurtransferase